jgi:hypothetical protein
MEPIHSGTTTGRILRNAALLLLVGGYSAWSLVDGYITYPKANVESAMRTQLGIEPPDPLPVINAQLTAEKVTGIVAGDSLDAATSRFGVAPFRHDDAAYYFGRGGFARLQVVNGTVSQAEWLDGPDYSATDLFFQRAVGFILVPVTLLLILQFVRVMRTRASLTDEGLAVRGKPVIPFEAMTGIRTGRAARLPTGVAVLDYELDDRAGSVRLDSYVVKEQPAILAAIRERKGFPGSGEGE